MDLQIDGATILTEGDLHDARKCRAQFFRSDMEMQHDGPGSRMVAFSEGGGP